MKPDDYIHVPNVVFTCGALRKEDGTIFIYYGGNDTVMNLTFTHEDILAEYPQLEKEDIQAVRSDLSKCIAWVSQSMAITEEKLGVKNESK